MAALEKLVQWLKTFPLWEENALHIDYTGAVPGSSGLYPQGVEEVQRREDVLGNVTVKNRLHVTLYRVTHGQQDNRENSAWLLQFQQWVQQQSALGLAPFFGDDPKQEKIRAEQGKLKSASQTGTGKYAVAITAEYVKFY